MSLSFILGICVFSVRIVHLSTIISGSRWLIPPSFHLHFDSTHTMEAVNKHVDECYDNLTAAERATMKKMVKNSVESKKQDPVYVPEVNKYLPPTKAQRDKWDFEMYARLAARGNPPTDYEAEYATQGNPPSSAEWAAERMGVEAGAYLY